MKDTGGGRDWEKGPLSLKLQRMKSYFAEATEDERDGENSQDIKVNLREKPQALYEHKALGDWKTGGDLEMSCLDGTEVQTTCHCVTLRITLRSLRLKKR
jgi:hypothetical protein